MLSKKPLGFSSAKFVGGEDSPSDLKYEMELCQKRFKMCTNMMTNGTLQCTTVMPEGEKHWGVPVVIGGDNLPSPVGIGLTDLPNIGGASPSSSGITV